MKAQMRKQVLDEKLKDEELLVEIYANCGDVMKRKVYDILGKTTNAEWIIRESMSNLIREADYLRKQMKESKPRAVSYIITEVKKTTLKFAKENGIELPEEYRETTKGEGADTTTKIAGIMSPQEVISEIGDYPKYYYLILHAKHVSKMNNEQIIKKFNLRDEEELRGILKKTKELFVSKKEALQ